MMFRLSLILAFIFIFTMPALAQRDPAAIPPLRAETRSVTPEDQKPLRTFSAPIQGRNAVIDQNITREREIVVLVGKQSQARVMSVLRAQKLPTLKQYNLNALESSLVITKGSLEILQLLRRELPDAEIDWNDDLSAAKGPRLYAKDKIKWPEKQGCINDALKIPLGLIDGHVDRSHPAFVEQSILEKNFLDGSEADRYHATAIASILIGHAPAQGFDGLLSGAKLYSAVALRHAPGDKPLASVVASVRGLDWLLDQDVRLINVSLAGNKNRILMRSFEAAIAKGALIFAAAGNNGPDAPSVYPAAIEGVFAITAIDAAGRTYKQANKGTYIDYAAPGVDIWVATPNGSNDDGGAYKSGTSFAVPFAVGVTALYMSRNKNVSRPVLRKLLERNKSSLIAQCLSKE